MKAEDHTKYAHRTQAGAVLGMNLALSLPAADYTVLGLLRGGVPVAVPVAQSLSAQLGVVAVKKLGVPSNQELAYGAIASYRGEASSYYNQDIQRRARCYFGDDELTSLLLGAAADLAAQANFFSDYSPELAGRNVVVVDDGIATGASMFAALELVRRQQPARVIVALPVGPQRMADQLLAWCEKVVMLRRPQNFNFVGAYYEDFSPVQRAQVVQALELRRR